MTKTTNNIQSSYAALADRLEFEKLVSTISTSFINLTPNQIDHQIHTALQLLGDHAGVDCGLVAQGTNPIEITHQWHSSGDSVSCSELLAAQPGLITRLMKTIQKNGSIRIIDLATEPQSTVDHSLWRHFSACGVKSLVAVPMKIGSESLGLLVFTAIGSSKQWSEEVCSLLSIVAQMFASVLAKKKVEQALRESEERFRSYFDLPLVGIAKSSFDGAWLDLNDKFCSMLGYSKEFLIGRSWKDFTHPDDLEKDIERTSELVSNTHESDGFDKRFICSDGSTLYARASSRCVHDEDGNPKYLIAVFQNITKRITAEQEILHQKEFLDHVINSNPSAIFTKNSTGKYTLVNKAFASLFKLNPEEIVGKTDSELSDDDRRTSYIRNLDSRVLECSETVFRAEEPFSGNTPDSERWFQTIRTPLPMRKNREKQVLGIYVDITERKKAEDALRALVEGTASFTAEDFFRSLVRHLASVFQTKAAIVAKVSYSGASQVDPLAFWMKDDYIKNQTYSLAGTPSELVMKQGLCLFSEHVSELFPNDLSLVKHGIQSYMGVPLLNSSGHAFGVLAVMHDKPMQEWRSAGYILKLFAARAGAEVTRIIQEEQARELERQLLQSQKMEAIGELAAGIAHDLNNSLSAVSGHLELVQSTSSANERKRSVDVALGGCERASSLVQQLLGFSRQGKYHIEDICVGDVVNDTVDFLQKVIDTGTSIDINNRSSDIQIRGDRGQLQQVLTNLILNAQQAMDAQGTITFDFNSRFVADPDNHNPNTKPGSYAILTVRDTGSGIKQEIIDKVFDPFFTTKREGEGSGLGLSMVYGIMQSHGGWVEVNSEYGIGTAFSLWFPEVADEDEEKGALENINNESSLKNRKILVLDDEPVLVELAREFLERKGFETACFTRPSKALQYYQEHSRDIDLCIVDMKMPEMTGEQCFINIRKINPLAEVVILSGYSRDDAAQLMLENGAITFFQKPLKYPKLVEWIEDHLDEKEDRLYSTNFDGLNANSFSIS